TVALMDEAFPGCRGQLERRNSAFSGVIGPDGRVVGQPLVDEEGIVYADIDLARCIQPRQMHDITGNYNRFDVFDLRVDRRQLQSASFLDGPPPEPLDLTALSVDEERGAQRKEARK